MIDFRYHLVSIVAIFLALALGIVLGSTTLSDSVSDTLRQQANSAAKTAQQARLAQRDLAPGERPGAVHQRAVAAARREPAEGPVGRADRDAGRGERQHRAGQRAGEERGAAVTGRVTIQKKLLDDDQQTTVDELSTQLKPTR